MNGDKKPKFEPLTDIKPVENANEQIDLKEKDSQAEPEYLEEETGESPTKQTGKTEKPKETAAPEQPMESTADYAQFSPDEKPKGGRKKLIVVLLVLAIVGGAAAYWFVLKPKPAAKSDAAAATASSNSTAAQSTTAATAPATTKISATTKSYTSPNFNLAFSYPDDWVVTDAGGGIMTVKSPSLSLKNATGQTVTGQIVFTIKNHAQKLTEFDKGNANATRDSLKIAYTKPTQTQRGNTYISYLQYAATTATGGLDGIYITGDSGYKKAQAIPLVDVAKVDPNITITFVDANSKVLTIADSMIDDVSFSDPLTSILKSLSIN